MQAEEQKGVKTLHDVAINGDAETLESYLESNPNTDINALDEYVNMYIESTKRDLTYYL